MPHLQSLVISHFEQITHPNTHTHLGLVADEQVVLHGIGDIVDVELQGPTFRYPSEPESGPGGGATRLVLPDIQ